MLLKRIAWVAVVLSGCAEAGAEDGAEASTGDLPSPYSDGSGSPDSGGVPSMGKEEAVAAAVTGVKAFIDLKPSGVVAALEALAVFEEGCPEELEEDVSPEEHSIYFYSEGCTTSAGLTIMGAGELYVRTAVVEDGRTVTGASINAEDGAFRLEKGDRWFEFSGYLEYDWGSYADSGDADGYLSILAELGADPKTAEASPLLAEGAHALGDLYAYESGGSKTLGGQGALSGPGLGGAATAFSFSGFAASPSECGKEPGGTFGVRDEAGFWHDVAFDAATVAGDDEPKWHPDACDGCGAYLAGGVEDGTACVGAADVDRLVAWEGSPW